MVESWSPESPGKSKFNSIYQFGKVENVGV